MRAFYSGNDVHRWIRDEYMFGTTERVIVGAEELLVEIAAQEPFMFQPDYQVVEGLGGRAYAIERELFDALSSLVKRDED